jgi:eukaryotic-like serine/threonine-protein kinase
MCWCRSAAGLCLVTNHEEAAMTVVELTRVERVERVERVAAVQPEMATQPQAVLLDGRYRLDELVGRVGGTTLWRATDQLLCRPVAVHLLPAWGPVRPGLAEAVQACARVNDARLATVFDVDYDADRRYIVSEWVSDPNLEQLLRAGLPGPAIAMEIVADAAEALAVAHRAGRPHSRLTLRCLHWGSSGLKITGLGIDAALDGSAPSGALPAGALPAEVGSADTTGLADTMALAGVLYALLTGYWPGDEATALPLAPRHRIGGLREPRQLRPEVPPMLNAIVCHALRGQPGWGAPSITTPAELAAALRAAQSSPHPTAGPVGRPQPQPTRVSRTRNCPDVTRRPTFRAA